jgi:hypothetical protein
MKKWLSIALVVALAFAVVYYKDPRVQTFFKHQLDENLPEQITHSKAYRWKDSRGQWTVSDKPPTDGTPYEEVQYHRDTNVIPAEKLTGKQSD